MRKSGLADSPFFTSSIKQAAADSPSDNRNPKNIRVVSKKSTITDKIAQDISHQDTTTDSQQDTEHDPNHATMVAWYQATSIELVRKAVKDLGKEAATHRFTIAEKKTITAIVYAFKNQGLRTSENEITRIAINYILQDYEDNGRESVLHRVLQALNE